MAHSIGVLVQKARLPSPAALLQLAIHHALPIAFDADWQWGKHLGWLPMTWHGKETGCEIESAKLTKKERSGAVKAGFPDVDTQVIITLRGDLSLQAGTAFAALVAVAAEGCLSEDEDEYRHSDTAIEWARQSILAADEQDRLSAQREEARAAAEKSGNVDGLLRRALSELQGRTVSMKRMLDTIGLQSAKGERISSSTWRIRDGDTELNRSRYALARVRQLQRYEAWQRDLTPAQWEAGELTPSQELEQTELEALLEKSGQLDEQDLQHADAVLQNWPNELVIERITLSEPSIVTVVFAGHPARAIEFIGGGLLASVTIVIPPLRFSVQDEVILT